MTAWKDLERTVAKKLGGYRIPRGGDFSESLPDVISDVCNLFPLANKIPAGFLVECKYRQSQPWIDKYKELKKSSGFDLQPYVILKVPAKNASGMDDNICFMPIDYLFDYFAPENSGRTITINKELPTYITDFVRQSYEYSIDIECRMRVHLYYWKLAKDQSKKKFNTFVSLVALGQKNDKVRLAIFYESELLRIRSFCN